MLTLLAGLPLLVFLVLIIAFKRSVLGSAGLALLLVVFIGLTTYEMTAGRVMTAGAKGVFLALEIGLIVWAALLLLEILKQTGGLTVFKNVFEGLSPDRRVQILIIGWCLVYFLEGVAGFGTPALIVVPILMALGLAPMTAVVVALIGDTVPVIFGAVGLPVTYGLGSVLVAVGAEVGWLERLPVVIAGFNFIGALLIPLVLLLVWAKLERRPFKEATELFPLALLAGAVAAGAAYLTALWLGPELPSIIGGLVALAVIIGLVRFGILVPASARPGVVRKESWPAKREMARAFLPYTLVLILLLVSRWPSWPVREWLQSAGTWSWPTLWGYQIDYVFFPYYAAGVIMLVAGLLSIGLLRLPLITIKSVGWSAGRQTLRPLLALIAVLAFVQIYIYSGDNLSGLPSMLLVLAEAAVGFLGPVWPVVAPALGALGSLAAGSATVSNLIFAGIQYEAALLSGYAPAVVLAGQGLGAAAGNMVALHNVIAALAVAGLAGREGEVIRINLPILIGYLLVLGVSGLVVGLLI